MGKALVLPRWKPSSKEIGGLQFFFFLFLFYERSCVAFSIPANLQVLHTNKASGRGETGRFF